MHSYNSISIKEGIIPGKVSQISYKTAKELISQFSALKKASNSDGTDRKIFKETACYKPIKG